MSLILFFVRSRRKCSNHPTYRLWASTSRAGEGGTGPHLFLLVDVGRVVWTAGRDGPQAGGPGSAGWRGRLTIAACTPASKFRIYHSWAMSDLSLTNGTGLTHAGKPIGRRPCLLCVILLETVDGVLTM